MSRKVKGVSVHSIDIAADDSPASGLLYTTSGSPNPTENRAWDLQYFTDRVQLSRIMKKRYMVLTDNGRHVKSIVDLQDEIQNPTI